MSPRPQRRARPAEAANGSDADVGAPVTPAESGTHRIARVRREAPPCVEGDLDEADGTGAEARPSMRHVALAMFDVYTATRRKVG